MQRYIDSSTKIKLDNLHAKVYKLISLELFNSNASFSPTAIFPYSCVWIIIVMIKKSIKGFHILSQSAGLCHSKLD